MRVTRMKYGAKSGDQEVVKAHNSDHQLEDTKKIGSYYYCVLTQDSRRAVMLTSFVLKAPLTTVTQQVD
jgi:hypothetical protein